MKKIFYLYMLVFINSYYARDIGLTWYDGSTQTSGASSCSYGDTFVPPTPSGRPGYVFAGWKVKEVRPAETCGIQNLNSSINFKTSSSYGYISLGGSATRASNYGLTERGTWATEFSYGVVYGRALCSSTAGNAGGTGSSAYGETTSSNWRKKISTDNGKYCWCQPTGFTASGNAYTSGPQCTVSPVLSLWIYRGAYGSYDICTGGMQCAYYCSHSLGYTYSGGDNFRIPMFGVVEK